MARIIKAAFSKTFPITQYYEKIYLEAELNDGDDARTVLYDLKKQVQDFFYESTKAAEKMSGVSVEVVEEPGFKLGSSLEDQINSCQQLKVLESYRLLVKNNPDLEKVYLQKLKELSHA